MDVPWHTNDGQPEAYRARPSQEHTQISPKTQHKSAQLGIGEEPQDIDRSIQREEILKPYTHTPLSDHKETQFMRLLLGDFTDGSRAEIFHAYLRNEDLSDSVWDTLLDSPKNVGTSCFIADSGIYPVDDNVLSQNKLE
ncbi:hypothetical protein WAI453_004904 [Rhynchosporium graminicola]